MDISFILEQGLKGAVVNQTLYKWRVTRNYALCVLTS